MFFWAGMILYPAEVSPILDKMMLYINNYKNSETPLSWLPIRFKHIKITSWKEVNSEKSSKFLDTAIFQKPIEKPSDNAAFSKYLQKNPQLFFKDDRDTDKLQVQMHEKHIISAFEQIEAEIEALRKINSGYSTKKINEIITRLYVSQSCTTEQKKHSSMPCYH